MVAASVGLAGPTLAQAPATTAALAVAAPPRGLDCMIQPSQLVQIGSPAPGIIERILVDRGDMVKAGQEVVQLNAAVERAALALARERAAQQGEVAATDGARELAERELARADELYNKKFVSATYRDKQKAEARVATGRSDEAQEKRKLAARELELASAQLAQRTLRAPVSGVVVERYMSLGEYVDQKPVLRIAVVDPLARGRAGARRRLWPGDHRHEGLGTARAGGPPRPGGHGENRGPADRCRQQHLPRAAGVVKPRRRAARRVALQSGAGAEGAG